MAWHGLREHLGEELGALQGAAGEQGAVELGLTFSRSTETKKRDSDRARYKTRVRKRLPEAERKRRRRESKKRWREKNKQRVLERGRVYRREWRKRNRDKLKQYHQRMWADPAKRARKIAANTKRQRERRIERRAQKTA
jgi:hypothetical protein